MARLDPREFREVLEKRTQKFSVAVFKMLGALPKRVSTTVISYQLGKSASSIGANYREANRAESGDDFRHKLSIALKEAHESVYWLEILADLCRVKPSADIQAFASADSLDELRLESEELLKLFQSILRSSRIRAKQSTVK